MIRKKLLIFLILAAFVLNANIFSRVFDTAKPPSLTQAQITLFSLNAISHRYFDNKKINPEKMLEGALQGIEEDFSPVYLNYDKENKKIKTQVYNEEKTIKIKRIKDVMDIPIVLRQIYAFIKDNYRDEKKEDLEDLEYSAVNGILKKLDPHSHAFTPSDFKSFNESTEGNFGGLGIVISKNEDGELIIVSPIDGTPAMREGVQSGDIIVQIGNRSAINMPLSSAVEIMRGTPGTDITIHIKREGVPELLEFNITRAVIKIKSVIPEIIDDEIGYLKITGFMQNTLDQMKKNLKSFREKGVKYLLIDFRNNAGGLLSQAIDMSDMFLEDGVIVSTVEKDRKRDNTAKKRKDDILDMPVFVLVNEGTASAAEIVTAALKKNNRGTILGRKTFGKGSVQNIISLPGGGGIKLTVAQYLTPGDISIQNVGITPDIELLEVYLHEDKIRVFNHETPYLKEADLDGHFYSVYAPEETPKPDISIRYFKEYKTPEELREERKMERSDVFRSDREIEVTVDLIKETQGNQEKVMSVAEKQKTSQWETIVKKMKKINIAWDTDKKKKNIDSSKLKISMKNSGKLKAGEKNTLKFIAEYPGKVKNLFGVMDTEIPFLKNVELPFGSFEKKIERDVNIVLPDHMDWYKKKISVNLSVDKFDSILKTENIEIETLPLPQPKVEFSYYLKETEGKKDGVLESGEKIQLIVRMKNNGEGAIKDGRAMLFNHNNNENVFIEKGSEKIKLKPGETGKVNFGFEISDPDEKEEKSIDISVNVYDYDTKFYSGFSIPMGKQPPPCSYKPEKSHVKLEKGTFLYSDVKKKQQIASVLKEGRFEVTGTCGDMSRLSSGKWISSEKTEKIATNKKTLKKGKIDHLYEIKMPELHMDEAPLTTDKKDIQFEFSAEGKNLSELVVFVNNHKMFYHWVEKGNEKLDFSIPLELKNKINRIKVIAKNHDSEQKTDKMKIVFYPDGKKLQY